MLKHYINISLLILCLKMNWAAAAISFSSPRAVNNDATSDSIYNSYSSFATDHYGNWIAVWNNWGPRPLSGLGDTAHSGPDLLNEDLAFAVSSDDGLTWSDSRFLKTNHATDNGDDLLSTLVTDGQGTWICVWDSTDNLDNTIGNDRDILFCVSHNQGQSWTATSAVNIDAGTDTGSNRTAKDDVYPNLINFAPDQWICVWETLDNRGGTWRTSLVCASSADDAQTWSSPHTIVTVSAYNDSFKPEIILGKNGRILVTWHDSQNRNAQSGDKEIYFSYSDDLGVNWSVPAHLNTTALTDNKQDANPKLLALNSNRLLAVWDSFHSINSNGNDGDILLAYSDNNGQTWSQPQLVNSNARTDSDLDYWPTLAINPENQIICAWTTEIANPKQANINYAVSTDDGLSWSVQQQAHASIDQSHGRMITTPFTLALEYGAEPGRWLMSFESSLLPHAGSDNDIAFISSSFSPNVDIAVLTALNGMSFPGNTVLEIHWQADLLTAGSAVHFELYNNQGFVMYLDTDWNPFGDGITQLTLPRVPEGTDYFIRVRSAWDPSIFTDTAGFFSITGGPMKVITPNGGENWAQGSQQIVRWYSHPNFSGTAVGIELWNTQGFLADLGVDWEPSGNGSQLLIVPQIASGNDYRLHIVSLWDNTFTDLSDAPFTIDNGTLVDEPQPSAVPPGSWTAYP